MAPRSLALCGINLILAAFLVASADASDPAIRAGETDGHVSIRPWISRTVSEPVRLIVERGFELAVGRLRERPECRGLFTELDADGVQVLTRTLYYAADLAHEQHMCHGVVAYTTVGGAPTWVCRRIKKLPVAAVALVLIHEALHHAGLGEWPSDFGAPRPGEIDSRVRVACDL